jgi:hypothetical protein
LWRVRLEEELMVWGRLETLATSSPSCFEVAVSSSEWMMMNEEAFQLERCPPSPKLGLLS